MLKNPECVVVLHPCATCGYQNGHLPRTKAIPCPRCGRILPRVKGWRKHYKPLKEDKLAS